MKPEDERPPRRNPKAEQKRALQAADVQLFARQYARRAMKGIDPNDRRYDREVEARVKRMDPRELDALLRDGEEQG